LPSSRQGESRRRRRDPADRRDRGAARRGPRARLPLRGNPLRLRLQARIPAGDRRARAPASGSGQGVCGLPEDAPDVTPEEAWKIFDSADLLCDEAQVREVIARLAAQITGVLKERNPLVLAVMGGSVFFAGNLLPLLRFPLEFDYVSASRYGKATSGGRVVWKVEPGENVKDRALARRGRFRAGGAAARRPPRRGEGGGRGGVLRGGAQGKGEGPGHARRSGLRRAEAPEPLRVRLRHGRVRRVAQPSRDLR